MASSVLSLGAPALVPIRTGLLRKSQRTAGARPAQASYSSVRVVRKGDDRFAKSSYINTFNHVGHGRPSARAVAARAASVAAPTSFDAGAEAKKWAHFWAAMGSFIALDQLLIALCRSAGVVFPSSLIGMFGIIVLLLVTEKVMGASAVSTIEAAVAPGVEWIGRWLPTFFCPSLVVLPLTIRALPGDAVAKLCGITLGGWLLSICFAAAATVTIRKFTKTTFQPSPPGKKPPGFSDLHRKGWAITAAASLALAAAGPPEAAAIAGKVFMMAGTIGGYLLGTTLPQKMQVALHPLVVCALVANAAAFALSAATGTTWSGVLAATVAKGAGLAQGSGTLLLSLLSVVILTFAFRIYSQRALLKRHGVEIVGAVMLASLMDMIVTAAAGNALGLPPDLALAIAPRTVTVALAVPIVGMLGASAHSGVTAAIVVVTGLLGANFGQALLTKLGYDDPIVRGTAIGASAHGLGTAALGRDEPEALPVAALVFALVGVFSSIFVAIPPLKWLIMRLAGAV